MRLLRRADGIMAAEGVVVDVVHMLDHVVPAGMARDLTTSDSSATTGRRSRVDHGRRHPRHRYADLAGEKSSVCTLAVERMYAYSGDTNDAGQYLYYGKTAGCVVTGNEDGIKACSMEILYAMSHIGYTIPPQADCGWIGEIGPGPSYGDELAGSRPTRSDTTTTSPTATPPSWRGT